MGTSGEDQSLQDDSDLEVDDHAQFLIIGHNRSDEEGDTKCVLEEVGFQDDDHEGNTVKAMSAESAKRVSRILS